MKNEDNNNSIKHLIETLNKLNYEQLEQLLCEQAKNNLKLKELLQMSKEEE